jgi:hypothetical protein
VPAGVLEVRGANSPWPVNRAADYVDIALREQPAEAVDVFDLDRQLDPVAGRWRRDRAGTEEIRRGSDIQEVDNGLADLEHGIALVLVKHLKVEHSA